MIKTVRRLMAAVLAAALLLSGCSSKVEPTQAASTEALTTEAPATAAPSTEAPATEAPTTDAPATEVTTTAAPTTEAPTTPAVGEKTASTDYDPATNKTYVAEGIEFQVPANWIKNGSVFYASADVDAVAFLAYSTSTGPTPEMVRKPEFIESFANGMKTAFQQDAEVISAELTEVNGREMILAELKGITRDHDMELHAASTMNADGTALVSFMFAEYTSCPVDYFVDFEKIIYDLKDAGEAPATTEAAETSSPTIEKTVSHDFDPATNQIYEAAGIRYQVPANWETIGKYAYPSRETETYSCFYYTVTEGTDYSTLHTPSNLESYEKGFAEALGKDGKITRSEFVEINGRDMHWLSGIGTLEAIGREMELTFVAMASADKKDTIVFAIWTVTTSTIDYSEDFLKIIENLKDVGN